MVLKSTQAQFLPDTVRTPTRVCTVLYCNGVNILGFEYLSFRLIHFLEVIEALERLSHVKRTPDETGQNEINIPN
jgi:hypothetical protein